MANVIKTAINAGKNIAKSPEGKHIAKSTETTIEKTVDGAKNLTKSAGKHSKDANLSTAGKVAKTVGKGFTVIQGVSVASDLAHGNKGKAAADAAYMIPYVGGAMMVGDLLTGDKVSKGIENSINGKNRQMKPGSARKSHYDYDYKKDDTLNKGHVEGVKKGWSGQKYAKEMSKNKSLFSGSPKTVAKMAVGLEAMALNVVGFFMPKPIKQGLNKMAETVQDAGGLVK